MIPFDGCFFMAASQKRKKADHAVFRSENACFSVKHCMTGQNALR